MSSPSLEDRIQSYTRYSVETLLRLQPNQDSLVHLEFDYLFWETEGLIHKPKQLKNFKNSNAIEHRRNANSSVYEPVDAEGFVNLDAERVLSGNYVVKDIGYSAKTKGVKNNSFNKTRYKPHTNPETKMIDELALELKMRNVDADHVPASPETEPSIAHKTENSDPKQKSKFSRFFSKPAEETYNKEQINEPENKVNIVDILNKSNKNKASVPEPPQKTKQNNKQDNIESDEESYESEEESEQIIPISVVLNKFKNKDKQTDKDTSNLDINALLSRSKNRMKENKSNDSQVNSETALKTTTQKPSSSSSTKTPNKISLNDLFGLKKG